MGIVVPGAISSVTLAINALIQSIRCDTPVVGGAGGIATIATAMGLVVSGWYVVWLIV